MSNRAALKRRLAALERRIQAQRAAGEQFTLEDWLHYQETGEMPDKPAAQAALAEIEARLAAVEEARALADTFQRNDADERD